MLVAFTVENEPLQRIRKPTPKPSPFYHLNRVLFWESTQLTPSLSLFLRFPFNPLVAGSSPARPTNSNNNLRHLSECRVPAIPKTFPKPYPSVVRELPQHRAISGRRSGDAVRLRSPSLAPNNTSLDDQVVRGSQSTARPACAYTDNDLSVSCRERAPMRSRSPAVSARDRSSRSTSGRAV